MDSRNNADEVLNDFKDAVERIDFAAYNPDTSEFDRALRIGLMWHLLCENGECNSECAEVVKEAESVDEIQDEIFGAKKYFQKYLDTQDVSFLDMAKDELRHGSILLKKANARLPSGDEKKKLKSYEAEIAEISEQLERE